MSMQVVLGPGEACGPLQVEPKGGAITAFNTLTKQNETLIRSKEVLMGKPDIALQAGVMYYGSKLKEYNNNPILAAVAYNQGSLPFLLKGTQFAVATKYTKVEDFSWLERLMGYHRGGEEGVQYGNTSKDVLGDPYYALKVIVHAAKFEELLNTTTPGTLNENTSIEATQGTKGSTPPDATTTGKCKDATPLYWSYTSEGAEGTATTSGTSGSNDVTSAIDSPADIPEGTEIWFPLGNNFKAGSQYTVRAMRVGSSPSFGYSPHMGIDLISKIPTGSRTDNRQQGNIPIYAVMEGKIVSMKYGDYNSKYGTGTLNANPSDLDQKIGRNTKYGTNITLKHANGMYSYYQHLYPDIAKLNQLAQKWKNQETIKVGEQLGMMGNNGSSTDSHLHFEYGPSISYPTQFNGSSTKDFLQKSYKATYGGNEMPIAP